MGEKGVPNRRYTDEFRAEAARPANSVEHNEAARRLSVPVATLGNGVRGTVRNFVCEATVMEMEPPCHANRRHHHANCRQFLRDRFKKSPGGC